MTTATKCDCGNKIDERDLAHGLTQCEYCETPEVPIYKINDYGDFVELFFVGLTGGGYTLRHHDVSVIAPNKQTAKIMLNDYLDNLKVTK